MWLLGQSCYDQVMSGKEVITDDTFEKVMRHQTTGWMFTAANVCNAVTVMTHDS